MAAGGMEPMDLEGTSSQVDEQDSKYGCLANFKIDKKIGKGQFSEVYRAINKIDGSVVDVPSKSIGSIPPAAMVITKCYSEIKTNCHFTINLLYIPDLILK
jgi:serine/threonine protein kinase